MKSFIYNRNHINKDMAGNAPLAKWRVDIERAIEDLVIANFERLERPETADQAWKEIYSALSSKYIISSPSVLEDEQEMHVLDRISYWQEREMPFLSCIGSYRTFILERKQLPGKSKQWEPFLEEYRRTHPEPSEHGYNVFA